jgi:hypothetical protein
MYQPSRKVLDPKTCSLETPECLRTTEGYAMPSVLRRNSECVEIPSSLGHTGVPQDNQVRAHIRAFA